MKYMRNCAYFGWPEDDLNVHPTKFEQYIGCDLILLYSQLMKELVELYYMKPNLTELTKKGIWFLQHITNGDLDYPDDKINVDRIRNSMDATENYFAHGYVKLEYDEGTWENIQKYATKGAANNNTKQQISAVG
jgi:hypothetical protein